MSIYILVHGGWHGAWCWEKLTPLLLGAGHRVVAPDLPGHGRDTTPAAARPWERYVPRICEALDAQAEPVILVGHSSGGMLITEAARQRPERIGVLVYLAAFLLPDGVTPPEIMRDDRESILPRSLIVDQERQVVTVKRECAREVFYADCTDEDAAWAMALLQPEPLVPRGAGDVQPAKERAVQVPRVYIETLDDNALGPATQQRMYTASPCRAVYSLPTGHSPFISAPDALARHLLALA